MTDTASMRDETVSAAAPAGTGMAATAPARSYTAGAIVKRLAREHLKPHLGRIGIAVACMLVIAASTVASMWLLKPAVDQVLVEKDETLLWIIPGAIVAVFTVKALAQIAQGMLMGFVGFRIISDLQIKLFGRVVHSDLSRLNETHSGRFTASFINDTQVIKRAVGNGITDIAKDGATALGLIVFIYTQHLTLAFFATVVLPVIAVLMRRLGKRTRKAAKKSMAETGTMATLIAESLDGIRIVKAYGQEEREIARMAESVERRMRFQLKAIYTRVMSSPLTEFITGFGLAAVIFYGGYEVINGRLTSGTFVAILASIMSMYQPLRSLANLNTVLSEGIGAAQRVFKVIDIEPEIQDAAGAGTLTVRNGTITLEKVGFQYHDGTRALNGVSLTVPAGTQAALVGPSGAGKSTVLNLIPRFYDVTDGTVTIDGQDIRTVTMDSLRRHIALVTQDPFLFDDTVRANIAYAKPDAPQEEIEAAARDAAAHDFIEALPQSYDTVVGEHGVKLSGGQRQRIAIARALLADAPILLLDEATSALDTESERQVQEALNRLMKGRTSIVIAHRLSTVIDADQIFVLDGGRLIEQGRHEDLLAQDGLYARLYRTQFDDSADHPAAEGA